MQLVAQSSFSCEMTGNNHAGDRSSANSDLLGNHSGNGVRIATEAADVEQDDRNKSEDNRSHGTLPLVNDVLLGRGRPFQASSGNKRMHAIISKYKGEYISRPRDQKRLFVEIVLDEVLQDGTRFLKRVETTGGSGYWEEVDRSTASEKVWHALRLAKDRSVGHAGGPRHESPPVRRQTPQRARSPHGHTESSAHGNSAEQTIHTLAIHISESLTHATESAQHLATLMARISNPLIPPASALFGDVCSGVFSGHPPSLYSLTQAQPMVSQMPFHALVPAILDHAGGAPLETHERQFYNLGTGPQQHEYRNLALNPSLVSSQTGFSAILNGSATVANPQHAVMRALSGHFGPTSYRNDETPPLPSRWPPL